MNWQFFLSDALAGSCSAFETECSYPSASVADLHASPLSAFCMLRLHASKHKDCQLVANHILAACDAGISFKDDDDKVEANYETDQHLLGGRHEGFVRSCAAYAVGNPSQHEVLKLPKPGPPQLKGPWSGFRSKALGQRFHGEIGRFVQIVAGAWWAEGGATAPLHRRRTYACRRQLGWTKVGRGEAPNSN